MSTERSKAAIRYLEPLTDGKLTLGKLILAIRQSEESSQVVFAKRLNISRQNLCDIEHERRFLSPKKAAMFAKTLGYSEKQFVRLCLQDLLDREGINLEVDVQKAA